MPDPRPRSDKQLVAAAAKWCRDVRRHFVWSEEDLVNQCERIARLPLRALWVPTIADVQALEAEQCTILPRWLRTARYAVEREEWAERRRHEWLNLRTWYRTGYDPESSDWFDCSWPLLFRDEFYLVEDLQSLSEGHVRALRRFLSEFRGPYKSKEEAAGELLRKLGINTIAAVPPSPADEEVPNEA